MGNPKTSYHLYVHLEIEGVSKRWQKTKEVELKRHKDKGWVHVWQRHVLRVVTN